MKKIILLLCFGFSFLAYAQSQEVKDYQASIKKDMAMLMFHSYKNFNNIQGDFVQDVKGDKYYASKQVLGNSGKAYIVEFSNGSRVYFQKLKLSDFEASGKILMAVVNGINSFVKDDKFTGKDTKEGDTMYTDLFNTSGKRVFTLSSNSKEDYIQFMVYVHTLL